MSYVKNICQCLMSTVVLEMDLLIVRLGSQVLISFPVIGQIFPVRLALFVVRDL